MEALKAIMFLKEKRCGRLKGQTCADGRSQHDTIPKEDAASPMVAPESVIITSVIDTKEGHDVATTDIPGTYLSADMDDYVIMVLEGKSAELMVKTAPSIYRKYLGMGSDNEPVLYAQLQKALYGCLKSALLFYKKLLSDLQDYRFVVNPYDACVTNKMIRGKQMTVCWHVDDLKISHADSKEVSRILKCLEGKYGKLCTTRGKVHNYLGMTLHSTKKGKVKIPMVDYLKEGIEDFPEELSGCVATPAADHLFDIDPDKAQLDEPTARQFHTSVAKLLFVYKRARHDIQTAVAFLTMRVKLPDKDNSKKLRWVILYLKGTLDLVLTLCASNLNVTKWWVDGSYTVYPVMQEHTRVTFFVRRRAVVQLVNETTTQH
eukprot:15364497-Ditylum_brightwellii.AAC.6